jgi:hypothetical protein
VRVAPAPRLDGNLPSCANALYQPLEHVTLPPHAQRDAGLQLVSDDEFAQGSDDEQPGRLPDYDLRDNEAEDDATTS